MAKIARMVTRNVNLSQALDGFLLFKQAGGAAKRTIDDYRYHVGTFLNAYPKLFTYEEIKEAALKHLSQPCSPAYRNIRVAKLQQLGKRANRRL
ncbi:MAG: hypothetical protein ACPL5F_06805 [Moorellaceae bacterium]